MPVNDIDKKQWITIGITAIGVVVASLLSLTALRQNEEFREQDFRDRVTKLEERLREVRPVDLELKIQRLDADLKTLGDQESFATATQLKQLRDTLSELEAKIGQFESRLSNEFQVTSEAVAQEIIQNHADLLRGPAGPNGLPGKNGRDGNSPEIDYSTIVKRVLEQLPKNSGDAGETATSRSLENKVYGSGDCFPFDPSLGVATAKLSHGGGICVGGIPNLAIRHTNGCSFVSFIGSATGNRSKNLSPGETLAFEANNKKFSFLMGCERSDAGAFVYPIRIYTQ